MSLFVFYMGAVLGSFLNLCIERIPKHQSVMGPRSHCTNCGHVLTFLELIPIFSYIGLRGRCKVCHQKISIRNLEVEVLTASLLLVIYQIFGRSLQFVLYSCFMSFALVLAFIDWDEMLLPTVIIRLGCICGLVLKLIESQLKAQPFILIQAVLTGLAAYGMFMVFYYTCELLLEKEGLGYGDVRLMGLLGIYVGGERLGVMLILAALGAAIYGGYLYVKRRKSEPFPFGPFLSGAALVVILWSH